MEGVTGLVEQLAALTGWAAVGVALVAVWVGLVFWKRSSGLKKVTPSVPPGSMGWPFLGETLEYLGAKVANNAAQFFSTRVAKYGEVGSLKIYVDANLHVLMFLFFIFLFFLHYNVEKVSRKV